MIFDFDGLILDTETPEVRSWQEIFRSYGAEYPEWYWKHILGRGAEQVQEQPTDLLRASGAVFDEPDVIERRTSLLKQMLEELQPLPGVVERLDEVDRLGIPVAIASSSKRAWVDTHLNRIGLLDRFAHVLCADDVERAKPFPDLYLTACQRLGAEPSESLALEDSPNGISAAKAAGLFCVAVPNAISGLFDLSHANLIVDSLLHVTVEGLRRSG